MKDLAKGSTYVFNSLSPSSEFLRSFFVGKVNRQSPKAARTQSDAAQLRVNRKNNAKLIQVKKRQELVASTRIFNGVDGAPRIIAVIPLSADVDARIASHALIDSLDLGVEPQMEYGTWTVR